LSTTEAGRDHVTAEHWSVAAAPPNELSHDVTVAFWVGVPMAASHSTTSGAGAADIVGRVVSTTVTVAVVVAERLQGSRAVNVTSDAPVAPQAGVRVA